MVRSATPGKAAGAFALGLSTAGSYRSLFVPRPYRRFRPSGLPALRGIEENKVKIGVSDLRIAAMVLEQNAILVTRNVRDFRKVPGLRMEDWSK